MKLPIKKCVRDLKTEFGFQHELRTLRDFATIGFGALGDALALCAALRRREAPETFWMPPTAHKHGLCAIDMARGLPLDQAAPAHQELLWQHAQCRENPDLDRPVRLPHHRHTAQATQAPRHSLQNYTGFECSSIRKNTY